MTLNEERVWRGELGVRCGVRRARDMGPDPEASADLPHEEKVWRIREQGSGERPTRPWRSGSSPVPPSSRSQRVDHRVRPESAAAGRQGVGRDPATWTPGGQIQNDLTR